ncbi:MAG: PhzF family phenazine biosynthesis protein [Lachnospiraceae bacterium]|nr:PhzF family phenazine biosynthesis protein [Lachnospiraceae bacterium]
MRQYIVDAFTDKPFSGNPAAVCVMDKWPAEEFMKNLAMENNLSETAFIVKEEQGYHLRWFTPASEVDLCGHATLASSFVIFNYFEQDKDVIEFDTKSGKLTVVRRDDLYEMNFPVHDQHEVPVTDEMESAFGIRPLKAILGTDLVCIFESEDQIRRMNPDQIRLAHLPGRGQSTTAQGTDADCVSRSFFPELMVPEDPVCGSAHCQIADYWSKELGKTKIHAYQASKRGGHLYCELHGNGRISISGAATLVAVSEVVVEP